MKILTLCETGAPTFKVSRDTWWQLCCPTIKEICEFRDTAGRLAHGTISSVTGDYYEPLPWWNEQLNESETILFNFHDWSI